MESPEQVCVTLERIKALGVHVSLDDFGTGYSSLSYLRRFALDELKIDRCFVSGIPGSHGDTAIVGAVIDLAHGLGMHVVAEGVETEAQRAFLASRGCDRYQGFLYSRPLPVTEVTRLLAASERRPRVSNLGTG